MSTTAESGRKRRGYRAYKASGVEWLGEVPEHWHVLRLKYGANLVNEKVNGAASELPYTGLEHIESWTGKRLTTDAETTSEGQASVHRAGDVLFGKLRPYLAKACVAENAGTCTSELLVLRPKAVLHGFLRDYLLNPSLISVVDSSTYGAKMPRASWDFIGSLPVLVPPTDEQRAIAAYLDRETTRIDTLIEKKRRQIELLHEKRAALISHAVTKGLDPNVPMKESGIEWLGEVPEYWFTVPVKRRFDVQLGKMLQNNPDSEADLLTPYIKALHVLWGKVDTSDLPEMWASPADIRQYGVKKGDLLVCEGGEAGRAGIIVSVPSLCIIQNAVHRVRGNGADVHFLLYVLHAISSGGWFNVLCNKATIAHFTREKLAELQVPLPATIDEQRAIAAFLDRETAWIDTIVQKVNLSIDRLREYRTALISAAVTGKLDVWEATT